ncbi:hypothetical protein EG328_004648 [Venturia inaequalis]|uniref:Uncharacterized protein n=1 Tax=Venturia inaequalis TaxID=5025 RepID=A0A8H3ULY2_VENIN|nr:hypothetical protein EG328_004648 [Venturia inaequalis]
MGQGQYNKFYEMKLSHTARDAAASGHHSVQIDNVNVDRFDPDTLRQIHESGHRAGLRYPGPTVFVVDISKIITTSGDSESPVAGSQSTPSGDHQRSYATAPSAYSTIASFPTSNSVTGGPVGPPTHLPLPSVSSWNHSGPPQIQQHHLPPYGYASDPQYGHQTQPYYAPPPTSLVGPQYIPAHDPRHSGPVQIPASHIPLKRPAPPTGLGESPGPPEKKGKWTPEEDKLAIELRRNGMKWDDIAKKLPGRSAISCRLRYQNYSEKRQEWDDEKKNKLARLYNRFKQAMWEMVAKEMGLPWRAIEAIHWQMGAEEMASRANVPVFQPHATAAGVRTKSPPGFKNPNLAPAPSATSTSGDREPNLLPTTRRRSSSATSRRRANSTRQKDPPLHLPSALESDLPPLPVIHDTSQGNRSDSALTPGSSAEYNGSPNMPPIPEERLRPETPRRETPPNDYYAPGRDPQNYQSLNPHLPGSHPRESPSYGNQHQRIPPPNTPSPISRPQGPEPPARDEPIPRDPS